MSIRKINNSDYKNLLISNLPTRPNASPSNFGGGGLSANQMKKAYDATPLFIIGRFNELIDYINGTGDARLADDILNAIKGVLASKVETGIEGIATLSDLFASVENGDLAKAIRVSDGKSLDETLKIIGEETIAEIERTLTEYEEEKLAPIVAEAEILRESVSSAQSRLSRVEKKVENLGAGLRLPVIEDTDVAYTKIVPDSALPYAEVAKVGGMSYSVDGSLVYAKVTEVKSIGKNLAVSTESATSSERGIELTRNIGKSYVLLNGTETADSAAKLFGNFKLPVGTYTASVSGLNSTDRLYVGKAVGGGVIANYIQTNSPKTFTLTEETECFLQVVWASGSSYKNAEIKAQIEHGNTATEYKPYTESSLPIPSAVQALDGYGLGVDEEYNNHIDWAEKKYYKCVDVLAFDGTEAWLTHIADNLNQFYVEIPNFKGKTSADGVKTANNRYRDISITDRYGNFETLYSTASGIAINTNLVATVGEFKAQLAQWHAEGKPLTVACALATPDEPTDISHLLPEDNFIRVEGGGTITAVNEYGLDVPTEIIYQKEGKQ